MKTILSLLILAAVTGILSFSFWPGGLGEPPRFNTLPVARDEM